jgi:hypothetical protein
VNRLRLLKRSAEWTHADELGSLFVVSLPRSLSSLLYVAAARALGLAEPAWTSDGEILNRERVPRRMHSLTPAGERFTLLGSAPAAFASMTSYLDHAEAVLDHDPLERALRRLYPDARVAPLGYIDHGFARTRRRLEAERRDSLVFRRLEWIVSAVRERLRFDDPREEVAEALP